MTSDETTTRSPAARHWSSLTGSRRSHSGRIDERVLNPIGFTADATGPVVDLPADTQGTEALVGARSARRSGSPSAGPDASASLVAGLAMAGVPLGPGQRLEPETTRLLGPAVAAAVIAPVRPHRPTRPRGAQRGAAARRVVDVQLLRVAAGAGRARRRAGALAAVGLGGGWPPGDRTCSSTQSARSFASAASPALELVLAPHGWEADAARVQGARRLRQLPCRCCLNPESALFGDVLNHAAEAAGGDGRAQDG